MLIVVDRQPLFMSVYKLLKQARQSLLRQSSEGEESPNTSLEIVEGKQGSG